MRVSEVQPYGDRWRIAIAIHPSKFLLETQWHYSIYDSEFEARAVREALHACL